MQQKVNLIMPMGGRGQRFFEQGQVTPKPLIELKGKPFFYWATQSVLQYAPIESLLFVVLKEHVEAYGIDRIIRSFYPSASIVELEQVLNGAVLTSMQGAQKIDNDLPVVFNDCDQIFYAPAWYDACKSGALAQLDGALLTFPSTKPIYSFLQTGPDGFVVKTVEKQAISDQAIAGAYCFRNASLFLRYAQHYLETCNYQEYFMSGVYNQMCMDGLKVLGYSVETHLAFGTPEEYTAALGNSIFEMFL